MRSGASFALAAAVCLLGACSHRQDPASYLSIRGLDSSPRPSAFSVCTASGCGESREVGYQPAEWEEIRSLFAPPPENPAEERERIALAVARMEQIIGERVGTALDQPMNRRKGLQEGQLDCIAEAANTTVALLLLERDGLLRFHRPGFPAQRAFAGLQLPHTSATVYEHGSGARYAIDSWFLANGEVLFPVPIDAWRAGYNPYRENPFHPPLPLP